MFKPGKPRLASLPLFFGLLSCFAVPLPSFAQSAMEQVVPLPPPAPPAHLVRELLEEDAQRALVTERRSGAIQGSAVLKQSMKLPASVSESASDSSAPVASPPRPAVNARLKGIVGVGGKLSTIVTIDGQDMLYRAGQRLPATGRDIGLRLVKIATPCAQFVDERHDTGTTISVCLNEDRP
ncbi:hypothetical protein RBI22_05315 [Alcaligenaceae bacterium C4P045]|nr:hypothetical protein [Alcaligenaceae bacterium C4P045]